VFKSILRIYKYFSFPDVIKITDYLEIEKIKRDAVDYVELIFLSRGILFWLLMQKD